MKVLVTEEQLHRLVTEEFVKTCDLDKKVKNALSDAIRNDKNFEKRVKNIAADCIKTMYRILFQRSNFYDSDLRN
ncbi:MAG: hypothetical protein II670_08270 [Alphaproteobacteria bacterium]|nr:hypothetical protein [Alphaproteobacteria bacterium]